jgi:hypothetical protein
MAASPVCLPPEAAAEVGHDHPHPVVRQTERPGQLAMVSEGILGSRPNGQFAAAPLGQRRARFHRRMLHVGDLVGLAERPAGRRDLIKWVFGNAAPRPGAQVVEHFTA